MKNFLFLRHFTTLFFTIFSSFLIFSQEDTLKQQLNPVEIFTDFHNPVITGTTPIQILHREQLEKLTSLQLSDALKLMAGVVIKDYGGIGGMKTISVRGFGAQHTMVAYEGISLNNSQTGQIDLSRISMENIDNLSLVLGEQEDILQPARQFAAANLIQIVNRKPIFKEKKRISVDFNFLGGSYDLFNPYLKISQLLKRKKTPTDSEVSAYIRADYLQSRGNYPYLLYYGNQGDSSSVEKRTNSDIKTFSGEFGLFTTFRDSSLLNILLSYYDSERGLPGATILYNLDAKNRLWDKNAFGQIKFHKQFHNALVYQSFFKFDYGYTRYVDPTFLNAAHYLNNMYIQREYYLSNSLRYQYRSFKFSFANDLIYQNMSANLNNFVYPERFGILSVLAGQFHKKHIQISANLLHSLYLQRSIIEEKTKIRNHFSPTLSFAIRPLLSQQFYVRFFYKNIFRMPTFNDLYYREVGNVNLNPEKTNQFNVGIAFSDYLSHKKITFSATTDLYFNQVRDKIVAIPNKNLFVWSMLNYGKVNIYGLETTFYCSWQPSSLFALYFQGNYTLQKAIDVSNKESKNYQHQIPYTPLHSSALNMSINIWHFFLGNELIIVGSRYALEQNVEENRLSPYVDANLSLGMTLQPLQIPLVFKIEVLNVGNAHYEIIRNYPMQGRSFRLKINLII